MTKRKIVDIAKDGLISGIFWSFGVTIGFVIISTVVVAVLSRFDTLPVIGNFVANIVEQTQYTLQNR